MILSWLGGKNLYAMAALVVLGGVIVTGLFSAGARHERRKAEAETAKVNVPIAEQRGQDEAQVPANDEAGKAAASAVAGAVKQQCIITGETARLLASLR